MRRGSRVCEMGGGCGSYYLNSGRVIEGTFMGDVSKVEELTVRKRKHSTLALVTKRDVT